MSKGVVLHLDNEEDKILKPSKNLFDQMDFDLDYVTCKSKVEFDTFITNNKLPIKSIIFDLMSNDPGSEPDFLEDINSSFSKYNVPVFIYSGYLQSIGDRFDNNGTVYKYDKATDIEDIFEKIKFYNDSGFIDLFCPGGELEIEINRELNASFTKQFSSNKNIEDVIQSIQNSTSEGQSVQATRVKNVFKRIAVRSLSSDLLAPIIDKIDEVHPIEHFYKRQSTVDFWTGDIWKNKIDGTKIILLTPRCDISKESTTKLLYCSIINLKNPIKPTNIKELHNYLTDNISAKSQRYIPQNVFFPEGGLVDLSDHSTIERNSLKIRYDYVVTLSDDFTNEIIGKFAYYFLRTGITTINEQEFKSTIESLNITENPEK